MKARASGRYQASEAESAAASRDSWMLALPTDRSGVAADTFGEARQFARKEQPAAALDASWTRAPDSGAAAAAAEPARPMSLAEAAALAKAMAGHSQRASGREVRGGARDDSKPAEKSLVDLHAEQQAKAKAERKAKGAKEEWAGAHPWKPWNRETDLDVRLVPTPRRKCARSPPMTALPAAALARGAARCLGPLLCVAAALCRRGFVPCGFVPCGPSLGKAHLLWRRVCLERCPPDPQAKPKGKESILNNQHMGTIDSRFGNSCRMQTFM